MRVVNVNAVQYTRFGSRNEFGEHVFKTMKKYEEPLPSTPGVRESKDVSVNDWVVVDLDSVLYADKLTAIPDVGCLDVNTMTTSNRMKWHWPERPDVITLITK